MKTLARTMNRIGLERHGLLARHAPRSHCVWLGLCLLIAGLPANAADYFVNKQGNDERAGLSRPTAFATIEKGLQTLKPGDTLAVGPGEYAECVRLVDFGSAEADTVVRAEIPGTVLLRGDRDAEFDFRRAAGKRFVYVAAWDGEVLSVNEVDTLTVLSPAADVEALEFAPGRYFHDVAGRKLYVSSSDFQPPDRHRYTLGRLKGHGFLVRRSQRVVIDGIAAAGFLSATDTALLLPSSGFLLHDTRRSVVRRCTALLNGSGITLNSEASGEDNVVEFCRAYGNRMDGIVGYNPSGDTLRDSQSFLNRTYGARFYGSRRGDRLCLLSNLLAWGNPGGDFWMKGKGLSGGDQFARAERCIALKDAHMQNIAHCIVGGGPASWGDPADSIALPPGETEFHQFLDREFADAVNMDFRPQATSPYRRPQAGRPYRGAFPFGADVYYVAVDGDDRADGLSMRRAWRTLAYAFAKLRPKDTLYVAAGRYASPGQLTARSITVRGRGLGQGVIDGPFSAVDCQDVVFERLHFAGATRWTNSRNIAFADCVFSGGPAIEGVNVRELRVTHGMLTAPLALKHCSDVDLVGNRYAATPAVQVDSLDAIRYSSYNNYPRPAGCWEAAGKPLSLTDVRTRQDVYSTIAPPGDADASAQRLAGRGPLGTGIGPHRPWQPRTLQLVGPLVHSVSDTTADIEWWSTLPVEVEFRWGDTPECANTVRAAQSAFYSYSLTGLAPGKTYYAKLKPARVSPNADPGRLSRLPEQPWTALSFTTARQAPLARTYYVAPDGRSENDGLTRQTAWKTLQHAADRVGPGDTVLLAGGAYSGTVYFRATGDRDKPITFKAVPGEKAVIDGLGERLKVGLVLYGKHFYRIDSLYLQGFAGIEDNVGGAENGAILADNGSHLEITRCHFSGGWGPCLVASGCSHLLARNCVFMHSMSSVMLSRCPHLILENNVFIAPLIHHLLIGNAAGEPSRVASNIFGENTRHKAQISFVSLSPTTVESNNCFYIRWPEIERTVMNDMTLPQYRARVRRTDSLVANPDMPGARGWRQGWQQIMANDFPALFAANPEVVKRGIGLQTDAFADFHFRPTDWPYNKAWADEVLARQQAASALVQAGKNAEALAAYTALAARPMSDRLRSECLDQAALCANRLKDYDRALALAKAIPLAPLSMRRQMALMAEHGKFEELLSGFSDKKMGGATFHLNWTCPELEDVIADAFYYRSMAHIHANDLPSAEADLKVMVEKRETLQYSAGENVHEAAWLRLGNFYRDHLKDEDRAMRAYAHVLDRTMLAPYRLNVVDKPAFTGHSEALAAATRAACGILRKQGKEAEARRIESSLFQAQAKALADAGKRAEAIAKYQEALAVPGAPAEDKDRWRREIQQLEEKGP